VPLAALTARTIGGRAGHWLRMRGAGDDERLARDLAMHARQAQRYVDLMGGMKGAIMKLGQVLSFVDSAGLVPAAYQQVWQDALAGLRADAPAMEPDLVAAVIEEELGSPPDRVFSYFSPLPIAAASIGQVHTAHLADGTELAVKVQYPGVDEAIRADLANTEALAVVVKTALAMLPGFVPNFDVRTVVAEVVDRVGEELDYYTEAANQREFEAIYRDHPFIHIPRVFDELSSARVLTMEMVDGRRWEAAVESPKELRDSWGEVINRFVWGSIDHYGLSNADPHPGNYLFHEDGTVTVLDFGSVKRFTDEQRRKFDAIGAAVVAGDANALHQAYIDIGFLPAGDNKLDPDRLLAWCGLSFEPVLAPQPYTYSKRFAADLAAAWYDPAGPWSDVPCRFSMPKDLVFLNRIIIGLESVLGALGPTADWHAIDAEIRTGAPPATELGRHDQAWRLGNC
jgi:predicted unusual protein kinase regulating ubiquinone biosynthesis (AarF/ABC1/UbiB family)